MLPARLSRRAGRALARIAGGMVTVAGVATLAMTAVAPGAAAQEEQPVGCGYAASGPEASTICWLDMTGFNEPAARTAGGQNMTVGLPGGYVLTYNLRITDVGAPYVPQPIQSSPVPTYPPAHFGTGLYPGIPGQPALYPTQSVQSGAWSALLQNIALRDSSGAQVQGFAMVAADAEATGLNEQMRFESSSPFTRLDPDDPTRTTCGTALTGIGTGLVDCQGSGGGPGIGGYGALTLKTLSPTTMRVTMIESVNHAGREGVAFGIQTSKLTLNKDVASRAGAADSFDVSVTSPEGTPVGTASTGTGNTASTGALTVLPRENGTGYTLSETGTNLGAYAQSWACSNAATGSSTPLPSGTGTSQQVSPQPGDDITCTITNTSTPPVPLMPWQAALGALVLAGGGWLVFRRKEAATTT
ncbi:hypothetical protein ABZ863_14590 [Saccharomonospora sp. NPDC046836]|uniref:hypothetical protein n=1 Tax=Saccharomonospora sp. NPDC046836 TaxID=3156921 RepID=UPI0033CE566F